MRHNFISSIAEEQSNSLAVVLKYHILVFLQNGLVELDDQAVRSLDRSDFDIILLDIASPKVVYIRIPQPREALKEKDVPHTVK